MKYILKDKSLPESLQLPDKELTAEEFFNVLHHGACVFQLGYNGCYVLSIVNPQGVEISRVYPHDMFHHIVD